MDGNALHNLARELYPIMRSITGEGVRETLTRVQSIIPLNIEEIPTGTKVLDWEIPEEWVFREGWIADADHRRVVCASTNNLHILNYSTDVDQEISREDLESHLYSLPDQPDAVPYRTSYYQKEWGFCVSERQRQSLGKGPFHVRIDAEHKAGVLNYGEYCLPGSSDDEILVSTHICHPSLANDNLSGIVLATALANYVSQQPNRHLSWRFVFVPGTIGAIGWLSQNMMQVERIVGGMVLTGLGEEQAFTWKEPRISNAWIDRLVKLLLQQTQTNNHQTINFGPYGYDERQYCSPGFNLPIGRLTRGIHGTFPEYHTSLDNLEFIKPKQLEESLELLKTLHYSSEHDFCYQNLHPYGEPQLGRRGLYGSIGAMSDPGDAQMAMLWVLNQSDGTTPLSRIAELSGLPMTALIEISELLEANELLERGAHASKNSKTP